MQVNNPIFKCDMPDPDVIRVNDTYYMVSTTMFFMPGGAILKSKDLVNWRLVSYIFETIYDNEIYNLENGRNAYGKGQWATSLIYHNNRFYACFVCHDMKKTFIYSTDDIEKTGWDRIVIDDAFHDMSFLFIEETPYLVYGNGDIYAVELNKDLSGVKEGGDHKLLFSTPKDGMRLRCEGCRAYVRNGYIYLSFIDIPSKEVGNGRRRQIVYRSTELFGEYEHRIVMDDDTGLEGLGIAQGPFIEAEDGKWYAMLFQDRGSCGRIPFLMPVEWVEDWPVLGIDGKVPLSFDINSYGENIGEAFSFSDSFNHSENKLDLRWQFNHNPVNECWSFTERPGYLRMKTANVAIDLLTARNTLTQRTVEPSCTYTVEMDTTGMRDDDYAGICAFMSKYGQIGVYAEDGAKKIRYVRREEGNEKYLCEADCQADTVFLKITFDFTGFKDEAEFFYSFDNVNYTKLGDTLKMKYTLDLFVGYRIGLFNMATEATGGYVDFRNFTLEA